ncbi:MAG: phosphate ABC transporter substrate-binding protein PstS [Candidatus Binataceae bacterium]
MQADIVRLRKSNRAANAVSRTTLYAVLAIFVTLPAAASGLPDSAVGSLAPELVWPTALTDNRPVAQFNFQPRGSGSGVRQLIEGHVEFAASDMPLTDQQMRSAPGHILHLPTTVGAVVFIYNLPGVPANQKLRLTGPVIADIFLGRIKKWNDGAITSLNTGVILPDLEILSCHRSDNSGTSYIVSDYLSKVSPRWDRRVGTKSLLATLRGAGERGSDGLTALVKNTPGALGYVELTYALDAGLPFAALRNVAGEWVDANVRTIAAAARNTAASMPPDCRLSITNAPGLGAYPVCSYTYFLIYEQQSNRAAGEALKKFLEWMLHDGQELAPQMHYAPLPKQVVVKEGHLLGEISLPTQ